MRDRWFSRRAVLLHLELAVVVPGCLAAGWWQATRALGGHGLSWFYSVEWPAFAVLAVVLWWRLLHEDPAEVAARRQREPLPEPTLATPVRPRSFDRPSALLARWLGIGLALETAIGIAEILLVPPGRPSGVVPRHNAAIVVAHGSVGLVLAAGALTLLVRTYSKARLARLSGWLGATGTLLAGAGGLLTVSHGLRLAGMALMLLGTIVAGFGFAFPTLERLDAGRVAIAAELDDAS